MTRAAQLQLLGLERKPTPEETAEALNLVPQLKGWVKSVESFAYQQANSGVKIPGFKLVQKRDGNRKWVDETAAEAQLASLKPTALITETKFLSPASLDNVFGKDVIDSLCARELGGTVLVEDSDNRPAVVVDKLATFQHLLTKQET